MYIQYYVILWFNDNRREVVLFPRSHVARLAAIRDIPRKVVNLTTAVTWAKGVHHDPQFSEYQGGQSHRITS